MSISIEGRQRVPRLKGPRWDGFATDGASDENKEFRFFRFRGTEVSRLTDHINKPHRGRCQSKRDACDEIVLTRAKERATVTEIKADRAVSQRNQCGEARRQTEVDDNTIKVTCWGLRIDERKGLPAQFIEQIGGTLGQVCLTVSLALIDKRDLSAADRSSSRRC